MGLGRVSLGLARFICHSNIDNGIPAGFSRMDSVSPVGGMLSWRRRYDSFPRMTPPDQPTPPQAGRPLQDAVLVGLASLAAAALLARRADGTAVLPAWAEMGLQAPAAMAWIGLRCGWFALRRRAGADAADCRLTLAVVVFGAGIAVASAHVAVVFATLTVFICGALLADRLTALYRRVDERMLDPSGLLRMLAGRWVGLVLLVTILLSLPLATHSAVPDYRHNFWDHILNNAYAAASSACLVGDTIYSLGVEYSLFGQVVIVVAMQLSGMGFAAIGLATVQPFLNNVVRLRTVLLSSLGLQAIAVGAMWTSWHVADVSSAWERLWWGLVHATGALWNGGLVLRDDGLGSYMTDRAVFASITSLAVIGSLSLPVIMDLIGARRATAKGTGGSGDKGIEGTRATTVTPRRSRRDRPSVKRKPVAASQRKQNAGETPVPPCSTPRPPWRFLAQWEAALAFLLLLGGAVALWVCETPWREDIVWRLPDSWVPGRPVDFGTNRVSLRDDMSYGARWTRAVFMSATLRSAGLQSAPVSEGAVSWPSYGLSITWMVLGGSAGGVAGGMRTTGILLLMICLFGRRRWIAQPGGRTSHGLILRASLLFPLLWLAANAAFVGLLTATSDGTTYEVVLESITACNNVGLSTGLSLHLTAAGRMVMILAMVVGRAAPVCYWLAVSGRFTACLRLPGGRDS